MGDGITVRDTGDAPRLDRRPRVVPVGASPGGRRYARSPGAFLAHVVGGRGADGRQMTVCGVRAVEEIPAEDLDRWRRCGVCAGGDAARVRVSLRVTRRSGDARPLEEAVRRAFDDAARAALARQGWDAEVEAVG